MYLYRGQIPEAERVKAQNNVPLDQTNSLTRSPFAEQKNSEFSPMAFRGCARQYAYSIYRSEESLPRRILHELLLQPAVSVRAQ